MAGTRVASAPRSSDALASPGSARARAWAKKLSNARRRVPRAVWIVLAVLLALYLLAVIASNVILRTSLLRTWVNSEPDTLHVDYTSAWSPYPGRVVVDNFTLRFQDGNVQMLLDLDKLDMRVDLIDLTRKKFHVRGLDGRGIVLRMRHKLASSEGQEGRLEAYPPITGFPDPPVRKPKPSREITDEEYNLWTIQLDDVASSIRELWIMEYRYRGEGSVAGGMRLKPLRELWLPPCVLLTTNGVLSIGSKEVIHGQQGRVEVQVDPYDIRIPRGTAALRQLTARADLSGEVTSLAPFGSTYLREAGVSLDGGKGRLSVSARVDHGLVHPESRIEWRSNDATVRVPGGIAVRSDIAFVGHVDAGKGGVNAALFDPEARPALIADVALGKARVWSGKDKEALATLDDARTTISTANNDLTAPFPLSAAKLDIAALRVPDLRRAALLVAPEGIDVRKGALAAAVRTSYRGGALDARADIVIDGAHVVTESVDVASAHGKVVAVATSKDVSSGLSFGGSTIALDDVGLRVKDSRVAGLGVAVEIPEGLVRMKKPNGVDASASIRVVPGDKVLALGASLASLPKALGEAPAGPDARANVRLHAGDDGVDMRLLEGRDGDLVVRGRMRKPKQSDARGAFLLEIGVLSAGVEIAAGKTHVTPFASKDWLETRTR